MATMKQIALLAGVSRGTVDRVLNHRGIVRKETEQRVLEIAQALNYIPNQAARNLALSGQQIKLGCVMFNPEKIDFFREIKRGIDRKTAELQQYGVSLEIRYSDYLDDTSQDRCLQELADLGVQGIVLYGYNRESTREKIGELADRGIPVITANTDIPNSRRVAYVGCDYVQSGRVAGRLMDLFLGGKGNVGIVQGANRIDCLEGRCVGFRQYLQEKAPGIRITAHSRDNSDDFITFASVREILKEQPLDGILVDAGNSYGACRAVELLPEDRRPKLLVYDILQGTEEMITKGVITATIVQQPLYQGEKPMSLLTHLIAGSEKPDKEFYYATLGIRVSENIRP